MENEERFEGKKYEQQSGLEWDQYEEIKTGDKEDTVIIDIQKGTLGGFIGAENVKARTEKERQERAHDPAIRVLTDNGAASIIALPKNKKVNPQSNLAKWKRTYGKYPEVGDKVTSIVNENGFKKVMLVS